jgi:UDP-N-acetylmuramate: L-alanyl-gamma-D-glutamyl-meso-diaminopimelate ligase
MDSTYPAKGQLNNREDSMPEVSALPPGVKTVHIMGIGGTAMAALAGMLIDAGYTVSGSDGNRVYPPMSDYLNGLGIVPMEGYQADNLAHRPDLVVVGNVVRAVYPEAQALLASDVPYMSFPALLGALFLENRRSIVVSGTHGKTTTSAIAAWVLESAGRKPGFLVGGVMANFDRTARPGDGTEFVIEGDEYDTAFFDKGPKFLHYRPKTAILTSIEFDHADIYRDLEHCQESFRKLMAIVPENGCVVARWDSDAVAQVAALASCEIRRYGANQEWDGRIDGVDPIAGTMQFTVLRDGREYAAFESEMVGEHNLYNQVAVVAALDREGVTVAEMSAAFLTFKGIKRRQEVVGEPGGVTVIDDFAHHPTAVRLTLESLRMRFAGRRLWGVFEPRSNTSRRNVFQDQYAQSFDAADLVVIARPTDQENIPPDERMDAALLVQNLRARGSEAFVWDNADVIANQIAANAHSADVIAVLSNGSFGGLHQKLINRLQQRFSHGKN